jgi:hypothetical protein
MKTEKTPVGASSEGNAQGGRAGCNWRLPSGRRLGEFAWNAGFLAPRLWGIATQGNKESGRLRRPAEDRPGEASERARALMRQTV